VDTAGVACDERAVLLSSRCSGPQLQLAVTKASASVCLAWHIGVLLVVTSWQCVHRCVGRAAFLGQVANTIECCQGTTIQQVPQWNRLHDVSRCAHQGQSCRAPVGAPVAAESSSHRATAVVLMGRINDIISSPIVVCHVTRAHPMFDVLKIRGAHHHRGRLPSAVQSSQTAREPPFQPSAGATKGLRVPCSSPRAQACCQPAGRPAEQHMPVLHQSCTA